MKPPAAINHAELMRYLTSANTLKPAMPTVRASGSATRPSCHTATTINATEATLTPSSTAPAVAERRSRGTNASGFSKIGDKERLAAGFGQCIRDRIDAAAVGVALKYGCAFSVGALGKPFPIKSYCSQIDL